MKSLFRGTREFLPRLRARVVLLTVVLALPCLAQTNAIDPALARSYFSEARALGERDSARLWGVRLDGPIMFVDRETRQIAANQADAEGRLTAAGSVFAGRLPDDQPIANTSARWAGVTWTIVVWPLPEDAQERARLLAHEMFHRISTEIGLPGDSPSNAHLDTMEGRYLMQLEWRALGAALSARGAARRSAVEDALVFRTRRHALFPERANEERLLELNEGLAEYTGCAAAIPDAKAREAAALRLLDQGARKPSFTRSFAYASGPAYGLLLDESGAAWRRNLGAGSDLGKLLAEAMKARSPRDLARESERRASKYDGAALLAAETSREEKRKAQLAAYRAQLVDGPVLVIPLDAVRVSFNPNELVPFEGRGTVYPTLEAFDTWGTIKVAKGALLSSNWKQLVVPVPSSVAGSAIAGDGWTLELATGWRVVPGERAGDFTVKRSGE